MSDSASLKIEGLGQALRNLDRISDGRRLRAPIVRALRKGAVQIARAGRKTAPSRGRGAGPKRISKRGLRVRGPGFLRRNIRTQALRGELVVLVGPSRPAFYGRFLEVGTRKMGRRPWLGPAFDRSYRRATDAIGGALETEIGKEIAKLRTR